MNGITINASEAAQLAGDLFRAIEEATDHETSFPVTVLDRYSFGESPKRRFFKWRRYPAEEKIKNLTMWVRPIPKYKRVVSSARSRCWSMNRRESN